MIVEIGTTFLLLSDMAALRKVYRLSPRLLSPYTFCLQSITRSSSFTGAERLWLKRAASTTTASQSLDPTIPDGMEGITVGMEKVEESLVFRDITLGDILRNKHDVNNRSRGKKLSFPIYNVAPGDLVFDGIKLMSEKKIGAVLVRSSKGRADLDDHSLDKYVGIFTERDYLNKVALKGLNSRTTRVEDIMTKSPVIASADERCLSALKKMTSGRFRHIPVVQNNQIIGLVSIGDLVKSLITSFTESVEYLAEYIGGGPARAAGPASSDPSTLKDGQSKP